MPTCNDPSAECTHLHALQTAGASRPYLVLLAGDFARRFVLPGDFARRFVGVFSEAGTARLLAGSWLEVPF